MEFHVEESGSGDPILFIHAGVADSRMWRGQMGLEGYRCIAFDQRGFGKTPLIPGPYSHKDDAVAILDQMGIDSAVVVGCSIGAGTAMRLAIEEPARVAALVLVGSYPSGWVPPGGFGENPLEDEAERAAEAGDLDRVMELDYLMWLVGYGRDEKDIDLGARDLFMSMNRTPVHNEAERLAHIEGPEYKLNDRIDEIDIPTLVISGAHDEGLLVEASHYLAEKLSNREAVIIEGAAHLPSLERPDDFNSALRAFLAHI